MLAEAAAPDDTPVSVAGYFTLTQCTVQRAELPTEAVRSRFPLYPLPVIKLAWLGVARAHQHSTLRAGETLLLEALNTARYIVGQSGLGIAVVTDPLTDASDRFFRKYGFQAMGREFAGRQSLFLGMKTIQQM